MRRTLVVVCIAIGLAACGGGSSDKGSDPEAACSAIEDYASAMESSQSADIYGSDDYIREAYDAIGRIEEGAPAKVGEGMRTIESVGADATSASDRKKYEKAQSTVNDWIRSECDLNITI